MRNFANLFFRAKKFFPFFLFYFLFFFRKIFFRIIFFKIFFYSKNFRNFFLNYFPIVTKIFFRFFVENFPLNFSPRNFRFQNFSIPHLIFEKVRANFLIFRRIIFAPGFYFPKIFQCRQKFRCAANFDFQKKKKISICKILHFANFFK